MNFENFKQVVEQRRSMRIFDKKAVPRDVLDACLDLALLSPNSSNLQTWEFIVVDTEPMLSKLSAACLGQNAATTAGTLIVCLAHLDNWRQHCDLILTNWPSRPIPKKVQFYYSRIAPFFYAQGPLNLWGLVKKIGLSCIGLFKPVPREPCSRNDMKVWASKSSALACQTLMLALKAHGYDSCPMEGFDGVRVRRLLSLSRCNTLIPMIISAGKGNEKGLYGPRFRFPREQFVKYWV
ncbi:MAG: nitroreductase family protein [Oligoflexales bacterium]|nr:nitroreductase family protein [Oligoflexales bacterium]